MIATISGGSAVLSMNDLPAVVKESPPLFTPHVAEENAFVIRSKTSGTSATAIYADGHVNQKPVIFLVDTGASMTVLSSRDARFAQVRHTGTTRVLGIGGLSTATIAVADLKIGAMRIDALPLLIMDDIPTSLLGLDALHRMGTPQLTIREAAPPTSTSTS